MENELLKAYSEVDKILTYMEEKYVVYENSPIHYTLSEKKWYHARQTLTNMLDFIYFKTL